MSKFISTVLFFLIFTKIIAQQNSLIVPLNQLGRDERFDKFIVTMPVFLTIDDTIHTMDFEGMVAPQKLKIKKKYGGYNSYGYGFLFFPGNKNVNNPGFTNLLFAGIYDQHPCLYIDKNNNLDFTDDGDSLLLPKLTTDSLIFNLQSSDDKLAEITIRLKRLDYSSQPALRKRMNEYYMYFYKDRELAGIDYCYREQRYITRFGYVRMNNDSFKIGLFDGNNNGLFNEPENDRIITSNNADTVFESKDELHSFSISKNAMYVEYNGEQYEVQEIDKYARFIKLKHLTDNLLLGRIKPGKKIPKFEFTQWNGEKKKIKKFRRNDVYLYFTGPNVKNFSKDTAVLRQIADLYPDKLKVIAFIEVNKSYELKIFGTYANLNYLAGFREREIVKALSVHGLPSSIWLRKRRKVVAYDLKPEVFLDAYKKQMEMK